MRVRRDPFWPGDAVTERPERLWPGRAMRGDPGWGHFESCSGFGCAVDAIWSTIVRLLGLGFSTVLLRRARGVCSATINSPAGSWACTNRSRAKSHWRPTSHRARSSVATSNRIHPIVSSPSLPTPTINLLVPADTSERVSCCGCRMQTLHTALWAV